MKGASGCCYDVPRQMSEIGDGAPAEKWAGGHEVREVHRHIAPLVLRLNIGRVKTS